MNSAEGFALQCYSLSCLSVYISVRLSVCLSVPALAASASVGTSKQRYLRVLLGFSWINMCGVSKKPSVQKLWREKANMQMS